jgi:hypothetical protein
MLSKYFKHAGLAALLLGCSLGLAQAQQQRTPPPITGSAAAVPTGARAVGTAGTKATVTGWNFYECYATQAYYDGTDYWVWTYNNDGSSFGYGVTTGGLWTIQNQLVNACQHGSYWVYCTTATCSAWNDVWIYTHYD